MTAVTAALQRSLFADDQAPFRFVSNMPRPYATSETQVGAGVSAHPVHSAASVDELGLLELESDTDLSAEAVDEPKLSTADLTPPHTLNTAMPVSPEESSRVRLLDGAAAANVLEVQSVDGHESAEDLIEFEEVPVPHGPEALKLETEATPTSSLQPETAGEQSSANSTSAEADKYCELGVFADADLIEYQEGSDGEDDDLSESPIALEKIDDELESPIDDGINYLPLPCVLLSYRGTTHAVFNIYQDDLDLQPIFDEEHDGAVLFENPLTAFVSEVKAFFEIHTDISLDFPQLDLNLNESLLCMQTLSFNRLHEYLLSISAKGNATTMESEPLRVTLIEQKTSLAKRLEELEMLAIDAGFVPLDEPRSESGSDEEMLEMQSSPINGTFFEGDLQPQNESSQSPFRPTATEETPSLEPPSPTISRKRSPTLQEQEGRIPYRIKALLFKICLSIHEY
ncbi:hypothetical protein HDU86_006503 [Geranomyces michiganensis]|nr:hypothetical protein HDU86_006503 [Geranomyces michiganensis]